MGGPSASACARSALSLQALFQGTVVRVWNRSLGLSLSPSRHETKIWGSPREPPPREARGDLALAPPQSQGVGSLSERPGPAVADLSDLTGHRTTGWRAELEAAPAPVAHRPGVTEHNGISSRHLSSGSGLRPGPAWPAGSHRSVWRGWALGSGVTACDRAVWWAGGHCPSRRLPRAVASRSFRE